MYVEANAKAESVTYAVPAGSAVQEIVFWYISRGSISMPLDVRLYGPVGLNAVVEAAQLKGAADLALKSGAIWQNVVLDRKLNIKAPSLAPLSAAAVSAMGNCPDFSDELVQQVIKIYAGRGVTLTEEQACDRLHGKLPDIPGQPDPDEQDPGNGEDPDPADPSPVAGESVYAHGVVHKDECEKKKVSRYIVRVRVNVTGVEAAARAAGFEVAVKILEVPYKGKRAATIKPVSDGRFAPAPLALLTAGGWGDHERIEVYRWKKGKPTLLKTLRVEDHVYARGYRLARAVATAVLRGGGKANFEWATDETAYNVCFSLTRSRQNVNGYPSR